VPVNALVKLPISEIVRAHRPAIDNWAGLVIDVTEEQIVADLALAAQMARELKSHNVRLAIDDFGRGYSSLKRLKELPFSELKLDRSCDCGTGKVNAPICKTVIDLAHNFGSAATAIGIEKASDALALTSMGCDMGQGFLASRCRRSASCRCCASAPPTARTRRHARSFPRLGKRRATLRAELRCVAREAPDDAAAARRSAATQIASIGGTGTQDRELLSRPQPSHCERFGRRGRGGGRRHCLFLSCRGARCGPAESGERALAGLGDRRLVALETLQRFAASGLDPGAVRHEVRPAGGADGADLLRARPLRRGGRSRRGRGWRRCSSRRRRSGGRRRGWSRRGGGGGRCWCLRGGRVRAHGGLAARRELRHVGAQAKQKLGIAWLDPRAMRHEIIERAGSPGGAQLILFGRL
jgi:EAL domain-containing protein (putative c-di-GMP-specific phosphodiesterase class I)